MHRHCIRGAALCLKNPWPPLWPSAHWRKTQKPFRPAASLASMMGTNLGLTNEKMARWLIDVGVSNTRRLIVSLPME